MGVHALRPICCRVCGATFQFDSTPQSCPRCGADNALCWLIDGEDLPKPSKASSKAQKEAISLGGLVIEPFEPYTSHIKSFDRVVGGLSKGFSIFISGSEGVGKSTLVTQIAAKHCLKKDKKGNLVVDPTRKVFLASAEEPLQRFLARAERLGFLVTNEKGVVQETTATKHFVEIFKTRFIGSRETDVVKLHQQIRKHKPTLIIYDSIRKFTHPSVKSHSFMVHGPEVVGEIVDITEELKCCALIISRLTKDGTMAGSSDLGYDSDAVCKLTRHKPKKTSAKTRIKGSTKRYVKLTVSKNRMGPEGLVGWFRMASNGMISVPGPGKKKAAPSKTTVKRIRRGD